MRNVHRSSVLLAACAVLILRAFPRAQEPPADATSEFTVLSGGRAIGTTTTTVVKTAEGWAITAREALGPPLNLTASRFEANYSADWRPVSTLVEGSRGGLPFRLSTSVANGSATTIGMQRGAEVNAQHPVSPQSIVVPVDLFPAYEALALRLADGAAAGSAFRLYVAPQGEIDAVVTRVVPHRLITPTGTVDLREFDLTLAQAAAPLGLEVWVDSRGRLARLAVPASWVVVIREDISSAMTREEHVSRPGDAEAFVPALGFSLAATVSAPTQATGKMPAVVLVGSPTSRQDRDEMTSGVPVLGALANALADAGFLVVRYDKRGVGRSGGRVESAALADYAGDALSVVTWLRKRKDVDKDRVAIVGYGDGAAAALVAAAREDDIAAVCLVAPPGQTGRELTIWQQQRALDRLNLPAPEQQEKLALQQRVIDAVLKGGDAWKDIPDPVRQQAETAWFKSWLQFDPADSLEKMKQPILIVAGGRDTEYPPEQAQRLLRLAVQRKKVDPEASAMVTLPEINHALARPDASTIDAQVGEQIQGWLVQSMPADRP